MFKKRWTFRISNCFFFLTGRGTQKRPQSQKSGSEYEKNDNKAEITQEWQELRARFFHQKLDLIEGLPKKWC